jgi:hypothetical protein
LSEDPGLAHALGLPPEPQQQPGGDGFGAPRLPPGAEDLWDARRELAIIRDFARARRTGPWAVLGGVLVRAVTNTGPEIQLPALTGGFGSLNLNAGLVGVPGAGKGGAERVAAALWPVIIETAGVGSGEGIAHLFATRGGKDGKVTRTATAVLLSVTEIDTLAAMAGRNGSTILAELRRAWMGEALGFSYADRAKRLPIDGHTYRLCVLAGIQPDRAGVLLDDAAGGTPQRFIWLPAIDPGAPDVAPPQPDALHPARCPDVPPGRRIVIDVCQTAREQIDAARLTGLRGGHTDTLDGHAGLARLKTAAALGLLRTRGLPEISEEDWQLAGVVMGVSDATRAAVVARAQRAATEANTRRGESEADRAAIVSDRGEERLIKAARNAARRKLAYEGGLVTGADLRRSLRFNLRPYLGEALQREMDAGGIKAVTITRDPDGHGGDGQAYQLSSD